MNEIEKLDEQALHALKLEVAAGDERAFRRLFDAFSPKLTGFALAMIRVKDGATEVVDQVFVRIWQQRQQITDILNIKVYLYAAVKNAALILHFKEGQGTNYRTVRSDQYSDIGFRFSGATNDQL